MKKLIIDPSHMGSTEAILWASFYVKGNIRISKDAYLTVSVDDLNKYLTTLTGKLKHTGNMYYPIGGSDLIGGIYIDCIIATEFGCNIEMCGMLPPRVASELSDFFDSNAYTKANSDGVYDIDIRHKFIGPMGSTHVITHNKDTACFDNIHNELYAGIDVPALISLYSESDESILILTGEPGTGKTCFAKKCLSEYAKYHKMNINVVYIKDSALLEKDSLWAQLSDCPPDIIVLDDLDNELLPRSCGVNKIVNNILSFSDGIFDIDTKIIITTNQPNSSIDSAIIRPGRCFDILGLRQLTYDTAKDIWINLLKADEDTFLSSFAGAAKISQAAIMSEYSRWCKLASPKYLIDPSISIRKLVEEGHTAN